VGVDDFDLAADEFDDAALFGEIGGGGGDG